MSERRLDVPLLLLLALDLALVALAWMPGFCQDFLPFMAGAELVAAGLPGAAMLPATAQHLMDSDPAFIAQSAQMSQGLAPKGALTGLLSPPPLLLPLLPLAGLDYLRLAAVWRLVLAVGLIGSMHGLDRLVPPSRRLMVAAVHAALLPTYGYALAQGQLAVLWLPAAVAVWWSAEEGRLEGVAAALLAVLCMAKLSPLVLLPLAWRAGRRGLALRTVALLAVWVVASLAWMPWSLWADFLEASTHVAAQVVPAHQNLALDAALWRVISGDTDLLFVPRPMWLAGVVWGMRLLWLGLLLPRETPDGALTRGWVVALMLSPLLWLHYLVLLPVLLAGSRLPNVAMLAAAGGVMGVQLGVLGGAGPLGVGTVGALLVHGVAVAVMVQTWRPAEPQGAW